MLAQMIDDFSSVFLNEVFLQSLNIFFKFAPIWLPIFLAVSFWEAWSRYVRKKYILGQEMFISEIIMPAEVTKTPLAMEAVFNGIHFKPGETTWINRHIQGQCRPWWSFEIVSIEGDIHFYVWGRKFFKNILESRIYAQYPEVEIVEAEDYSRMFDFEKEKTSLWACDFALTKEDAYPIKTYIDYKLDETSAKEEQKTDPIGSVLEYMASIGKGEQIWYQIIIQHTKDDRPTKNTLFGRMFGKKVGWKEEANKLVQKLRKETLTDPYGDYPAVPNPTKGQSETMAAIERSTSKLGFDCGIRGAYLSNVDTFDASNIAGLTSAFKQYNSNTLNGFKPVRWHTIFDWPWQDFKDIRKDRRRKNFLDAYRQRSWFHPPYKTPVFTLSTEELATIFHIPGSTVQTPSIARITSRRGSAPSNLPR